MKYLLLLFLASCGVTHGSEIQVVPEAQPYVDRFIAEISIRNDVRTVKDLKVVWNTNVLLPGDIARCFTSASDSPTVYIDRYHWFDINAADKEQLIFHELGHCILKRSHVRGFTAGIPTSAMVPSLMPSDVYISNHDYYMNELFN